MAKKVISNKYIIVCINIQLFVDVVFGIHISIACWIVKVGGWEPAPYIQLKIGLLGRPIPLAIGVGVPQQLQISISLSSNLRFY